MDKEQRLARIREQAATFAVDPEAVNDALVAITVAVKANGIPDEKLTLVLYSMIGNIADTAIASYEAVKPTKIYEPKGA